MCQRWGVGPTQIIEREDAGYVLALIRVIGSDSAPAVRDVSPEDAMLDDLIDRSEVVEV